MMDTFHKQLEATIEEYEGYLSRSHYDDASDVLSKTEAKNLQTRCKGYKDAAAVLAGSTLEVHMRKLCDKHNVKTTSTGKSKNAETLNMELAKAGAYTKLDQKNLTAWLGLRNNAAHGKYDEYTKDQVRH